WPADADGTGFSLQRLVVTDYGNDPINWTAASPTPGPQSAAFDSDHDGMPDAWENAHGLNPYDPSDAALDIDGDALTNLQEFQLGTDPRDPQSGLHFTSIGLGTNQVLLTFSAAANISYAIQCTDKLVTNGTNNWQQIASFAAVSTNRVITHSVAVDRLTRFY